MFGVDASVSLEVRNLYSATKAKEKRRDNQGAINLAKNPKHIAIHDLFCRERLNAGEIDVQYCPTNKMLADIMTKAVARPMFREMCLKLGIKDIKSIRY